MISTFGDIYLTAKGSRGVSGKVQSVPITPGHTVKLALTVSVLASEFGHLHTQQASSKLLHIDEAILGCACRFLVCAAYSRPYRFHHQQKMPHHVIVPQLNAGKATQTQRDQSIEAIEMKMRERWELAHGRSIPTPKATSRPAIRPSFSPSLVPSPTLNPIELPTALPTRTPTTQRTEAPTRLPTPQPTELPLFAQLSMDVESDHTNMGFRMVHVVVTIAQPRAFCEFKFALGNGVAILEKTAIVLSTHGGTGVVLSANGAGGVHGMTTSEAIMPGGSVRLTLLVSMPASKKKKQICVQAGAGTSCDCPFDTCSGGSRTPIKGSGCR
jgi:hypothetical protein